MCLLVSSRSSPLADIAPPEASKGSIPTYIAVICGYGLACAACTLQLKVQKLRIAMYIYIYNPVNATA